MKYTVEEVLTDSGNSKLLGFRCSLIDAREDSKYYVDIAYSDFLCAPVVTSTMRSCTRRFGDTGDLLVYPLGTSLSISTVFKCSGGKMYTGADIRAEEANELKTKVVNGRVVFSTNLFVRKQTRLLHKKSQSTVDEILRIEELAGWNVSKFMRYSECPAKLETNLWLQLDLPRNIVGGLMCSNWKAGEVCKAMQDAFEHKTGFKANVEYTNENVFIVTIKGL